MKKYIMGASLLLVGCAGGPDPVERPRNPRSVCDSYAAQAIQTEDLMRATTLSAQASQCYSDLQNQRDD